MKFRAMNPDEKKDWIETFVGGAFGIVAILAAVVEYALGDNGANAGMIKDVFGTLVVVVLLFAAMPKRKKFDFAQYMTNALEEWMGSNANMISRTEKMPSGHENDFGMSMKTDMNDFYSNVPTTKRAGWFVRLPEIKVENYREGKIEINFHMNEETFFGRGSGIDEETKKTEFDKLGKLFAGFIDRKFSGFAAAAGKGTDIKVVVFNPVTTKEDVDMIVDLINTMYTAYLVSSHFKVK